MFLPLLFLMAANAQVTVTSTTGTGSAGITYSTVTAAFTAINAGAIHTGVITVAINSNTTETGSAVLNGSGVGSASYTSLLIQPSADGVTITGNFATTGRGVLELNGADNVTINGDNPNTSGTNKNLTITFSTAQAAAQSLVRLVTSASLHCNNVTVKNCVIKGNVTNGNSGAITSSTSAAALSMGIVAAGGGNTAPTAPSALATSGIANIATIGSTADNFTVDNCTINFVGVGVHFYGNTTASSSQVTVTNNIIGTAGSLTSFPGGPSSTVYFKGIFYRGIKALTITGNTIQGICSYFIAAATPNFITAIECNSTFNNGGGTFNISNNTVTGVWCNNASAVATSTQAARGIMMLGSVASTNIICNKNTVSSIKSNTISSTTIIGAVALDFGVNATGSTLTISNNNVSGIYAAKASGAAGVSLSSAGNSGNVYNNVIRDISTSGGGTTTNSIVAGIRVEVGKTHKIYHNSVFLNAANGNYQHLSGCFVGLATTAASNIDVRNNIFANYCTTTSNTTSADAAVILNSALNSSIGYTLNNNAYFGPTSTTTNYLAYLYNTSSFTNPGSSNSYSYFNFSASANSPSTNYRSFSSTLSAGGTNDNASFTATLLSPSPFASSTDLHISSAFADNPSGTRLESKGATGLSVTGAGLATDFEGDTRNGPSGSVNGGATAPDLGADEFDGKPFVAECSGTPAAGTITSASPDVYCAGSLPASRTFTIAGFVNNVESIIIQWQSSTTSSSTGFTAITGENGTSYTTTVAPIQTTWYRAAIYCTKSALTGYQAVPGVTQSSIQKRWIGGAGNWSAAANWTCGVPLSTDAVVIDNGSPVMDVNFAVGNTLMISGTGELTVSPGSTLSVLAGGTADFGGQSVTFLSTATGTASLGQVAGMLLNATNVTVERYIPQNTNRAWRLLSAPTHGQTIKEAWQEDQGAGVDGVAGYGTNITSSSSAWAANGFDFKTGSPSLLYYDATASAYVGVDNTSLPIDNKPGYLVYIRGNRSITPSTSIAAGAATVLRTTGSLNSGTQPIINVAADKFALVGNPYPSALDLRNITLGGGSIGSSYYVWDPKLLGSYNVGAYQTLIESGGSYIVVPGGGSFGGSGSVNNTIESGAAFYVQAVGSAGTVTISESSKAAGSRMVFRPTGTTDEVLGATLFAKNNGVFTVADGAMVLFNDTYQNNINGFDNKKINNLSENFSILDHGSNLVVEKRQPIVTDDTVFFKSIYLKKIDYRLQIAATNLDHPGMTGLLEDSYTNISTSLKLNDTTFYDFSVDNNAASSSASRFSVVFKPSIVLPVSFTNVRATPLGKKVSVNWEVSNQINITNYTIEKSVNGHDFTTAGTITATGANSNSSIYNWLDASPLSGFNYYRIKSNDISGSFKYSIIVKVLVTKTNPVISVLPNPVQGNIANVKLTDVEKGNYTFSVSALNGKLLYTLKQYHNGVAQAYQLELPKSLSTGLYQLTVTGAADLKLTQKLLIINK